MSVFTWIFRNMDFFTIDGIVHFDLFTDVSFDTHISCLISHNYKCSFYGFKLDWDKRTL